MLEIKDLWKGYYKTKVVKAVNIKIDKGEIHGLIGENSAGKTTLIKCVAGVYKPDEGEIIYDGKPVYNNPKVKEHVGYVADSNEYISLYTVSKMVDMYETFYPKFDREKFNSYNEVFKLPVGKRLYALSKGQKMRLAFMLETAKQPDYLILDEPTSGLDPVAKSKFFEMLINEVEHNNIGVLISSHNLEGLERICDSVTMLHEGVVERQMSMEDMKCQLTRLNVVFEGGAGKKIYEMPQILRISNVGSIYTLVVRDFDEEFVSVLKKNGASLVEPLDISLEELFVVLEESKEQNDGTDVNADKSELQS
ncbi:MAG: ABC transporter ATP-binding protein [Lachnospiraceae bacterium]|nr:ABC transporter ATP-binding protein [Lachnospiraceae bacterium]